MNEEKFRQIIQEEIAKVDRSPTIKDVHLHIQGDDLNVFRLLERIASLENERLETQVLERLGKRFIDIEDLKVGKD